MRSSLTLGWGRERGAERRQRIPEAEKSSHESALCFAQVQFVTEEIGINLAQALFAAQTEDLGNDRAKKSTTVPSLQNTVNEFHD